MPICFISLFCLIFEVGLIYVQHTALELVVQLSVGVILFVRLTFICFIYHSSEVLNALFKVFATLTLIISTEYSHYLFLRLSSE